MTQQPSDLELAMDSIVLYANMNDRLQQRPRQFMVESGFRIHNSLGVMVYRKDDPAAGDFLLVYDNEGDGIPQTFADIEMCRYSAAGVPLGQPIDINGNQVAGEAPEIEPKNSP